MKTQKIQTMMSKTKFVLLALFVAFSFSCSPEDGADGADGAPGIQGEQGPAGTNGTDGANGEDGEDGEDGNANVISSQWLSANWNESDTDTEKIMRITPEQIGLSNSALTNNSLIIIYLKQYGTSNIYTLPSSGRWNNAWYSFTFGNNQSTFTGIRIKLESTNGATLTEYQHAGFRGNSFRYVIIPATNKNQIDFTKMTYEDTMSHFGLEP
ncbi:Collagen triple helix repeat-containing protein [Bizionia echini]|uniref:Collagen triple helix repeat-containing protein n=1 Tax=Bizionia echini TaxID=649333 RepID=A0A1I5DK00_9FLAO|nr:collagen-like protein [Bizionia echini]SFN99562.1 Collagen triple helix repeat-containing protein [Bizionia echini]